MILNKDSWHYKMWLSSFSEGELRPQTTDLCRYCHRVFWQLVGRLLIVLVICFALWMSGWLFLYKALYLHTLLTLIIAGVIGVVVGIIALYVRWMNGHRYDQEPTTLLGKYAKASKDRVCPLIEFKD